MKKKYFLISICAICSLLVNAQTEYKRCLDDGVVRWSLAADVIDLGLVSTEVAAFGDTLINNVLWKKIYEGGFYNNDFEGNDIDWINHTPVLQYRENVFIRESEDASKLYLLDPYYNREYLVSDLNLQVGDKFKLPPYYYGDSVLVDSVCFRDGLKHIYLDYDVMIPYGGLGKLTFVEGVGSNTLFENFFWGESKVVHCFQNQTLFYKNVINGNFDYPCGYYVETDGVISIFDNESKIIIEKGDILISSLPNNSQIYIYNINGILQYKKENISQDIIIPTSALSRGVYILRISDKDNNKSSVTKIIL